MIKSPPMSLSPKVKIISQLTAGIQAADNTGLYDAVSNIGGWGTPNPNKMDVTGILASVTPLAQPEVAPTRFLTTDAQNYLFSSGVLLPGGKDGVYVVNIRLGFAGVGTLTATAGSTAFTLTNADAIFVSKDGFTIDSISTSAFYRIDRTKPLTSTGGFVTSNLPQINAAYTAYQLTTINALISQAGFACLNLDISNQFCGTDCDCCEGEDAQKLLCRYGEYLAMLNKFTIDQDFAGADTLARKLQQDCSKGLTPCFVQGTQPNVPFGGNPPTITIQPVNQSAQIGQEAIFSVNAVGTQPLSYQWYKNGVPILGAVGSSLTFSNVAPSDGANYYCIVSNVFGTIQSNTVTLTVGSSVVPVTITQQPTSQSGTIGSNVVFSLTAAGTAPITYQWYKAGVAIGGATTSTLNLNNIQVGDIANYYCIVTGPSNNIQSNTVTINQGIQVGWGWMNSTPATLQDLTTNQKGNATITTGNPVVADFRGNTNFQILYMFEPSTEPAKTKWYGDVNNNGPIGDPNNDLFITETIGAYRVYYTVFPTQQTGTVLQFLTSSQSPS